MIESLVLLKVDEMTQQVADGYDENEISFEDDVFKSCMASNFTRGRLALMKIMAYELTDSHKDYHVVSDFIAKIEEYVQKEMESIKEEDIEEMLTENEIELINFLKDDMEE